MNQLIFIKTFLNLKSATSALFIYQKNLKLFKLAFASFIQADHQWSKLRIKLVPFPIKGLQETITTNVEYIYIFFTLKNQCIFLSLKYVNLKNPRFFMIPKRGGPFYYILHLFLAPL